jgi:hypothetical protein
MLDATRIGESHGVVYPALAAAAAETVDDVKYAYRTDQEAPNGGSGPQPAL